MEITKKQLLENKKLINEDGIETALMIAGFVPVIGEIADLILIIRYIMKKEYLYAALMLIALIPTVGDILVKPIIKVLQGTREGVAAMKGGVELTTYLAKNPEMAKKFASLSKYVKSPEVVKTVEGIGKINTSWAAGIKKGLNEISGGAMLSGLKAGTKEVAAGGAFKTGLKDYFQGQRLSKYFAKKGVLPETGIQKWWLNVGARQDRRNAFRKFISANNLLSYFGIPTLTDFEEKMSNDPKFRNEVANNPQISDYIAQNYQPSDNQTQPSSGGGMMKGIATLGMLKMLAKLYT